MEETKRGRTYVAIVLDRSGSMDYVKRQTVTGYNEQVQVLLEEASKPDRGETFASLITFNGRISEDFFNAPVDILREMTEDQYRPTGSTAYYDALGYTINKLCETTDPDDEYNSYLVISISDGENNVYKAWTQEKINERITELEKTNRWTFTFIGANVDIRKVQKNLGFKSGNTVSYESTSRGTQSAFAANAKQMRKWMDDRAESLKCGGKNHATSNFYEGATNVEELENK